MTKTNLKTSQESTTNSNGEIFIKSIKITNGLAKISYSTTSDLAAVEATYDGKEEVADEFLSAFKENINVIPEILKPFKQYTHNLSMNVIRFEYDSKGFLESAAYSIKYAFHPKNNSVVNLNLPKLPIYKEEFGDDNFCISGKDIDNLHKVIAKAKSYMKGETKTRQMKLVVDNT